MNDTAYTVPPDGTHAQDRQTGIALFHLPGLFEAYEFYKVFLPLYYSRREYFDPRCVFASLYGAPEECLWGGGRFGGGEKNARNVLSLTAEYGISARLTFSNSLLREEHLADEKCNSLCALFAKSDIENGVIVHSELLTDHLRRNYPGLYLVSSTTKTLTEFDDLASEVRREEFRYVVPDFRLNKQFDKLDTFTPEEKNKLEFLCNEGCFIGCKDRKACYESVSRRILGEEREAFVCRSPGARQGYRFSEAMKSPAFIGTNDIFDIYLPSGFTNFKLEGRNLGSALLLEFLLYYMTKPEYRLKVREEIYLDSMLDLF